MIRCLLHIALLFFIGNVYAQEPSTKFNNEETLIGKPVSLTYKLVSDAPMNIKMRPIEGELLGQALTKDTAAQQQIELEVLAKVVDTTYEKGGRYFWEQQYELTAWDSALIMLPPQEVTVNDSVMAFPAALFSFTYPPADGQDSFYDINELFSDVEATSENWFLVLVKSIWFWIGLVAFVVLLVVFLLRKKSNKAEPVEVLPPDVVALKAIKELEDSELYNKDLKEFYVKLSFILRTFLTRYFDMRLMDKTSTELVAVLKMKKFSNQTQQLTRDVLSQSDLVKFAKSKPPLQEVLDVTGKARIIIKEVVEKSNPTQIE